MNKHLSAHLRLLWGILLMLACSPYVKSITITWNGSVDLNWHEPGNWDPAQVPTIDDDVIIEPGHIVDINGFAQARSVDLQPNSTLNLHHTLEFVTTFLIGADAEVNCHGNVISYSGGLLVNAGTFLVKSPTYSNTPQVIGAVFKNNGICKLLTSYNFILKNQAVFNNFGTFSLESSGDIVLNDATFNNKPTGQVMFLAGSTGISAATQAPNLLKNEGQIIMNSTYTSTIDCVLDNAGGTLSAQAGTLIVDFNTGSSIDSSSTITVSSTAAMKWNGTLTLNGAISGTLDNPLYWENITVSCNSGSALAFAGADYVQWGYYTDITGDSLTINSPVHVNLSSNYTVDILDGLTLTNNDLLLINNAGNLVLYNSSQIHNFGTIRFTSHGDLQLYQGTLTNHSNATISFEASGSYIDFSGDQNLEPHLVHNDGTIKCNVSGTSGITAQLKNWGTLHAISGTLEIDHGSGGHSYLYGGTYHVDTGASMLWNGNVHLSGQLDGTLDAPLRWTGVNIICDAATTLNFSGQSYVSWENNLALSGNTLKLQSPVRILNNSSSSQNEVSVADGMQIQNFSELDYNGLGKFKLNGTASLENHQLFKISSGGHVYVDNGSIDNLTGGTIRFTGNGGDFYKLDNASQPTLNNAGIIEKTSGTGTNRFDFPVSSSGLIQVVTGELEFNDNLTNAAQGTLAGTGTIDLPPAAYFFNDGTCAPGLSPGTLTLLGDFTSSSTSVLEIELNGYQQGSEYDHLYVTGSITLDGSLSISLGFAPQEGDEFVVVSTPNGTISSNLPSSASATYNGGTFSFNLINTGTTLKLKVTAAPLPVELISFTGKLLPAGEVLLEWATASEFNASHFEIERSADGLNFRKIGEVPATGGAVRTDYSFIDPEPTKGINYYRLRQVDFDGQFSHSKVVVIEVDKLIATTRIFPNPVAQGGVLHIDSPLQIRQLDILSSDGRTVLSHQKLAENQTLRIENISPGTYFIRLTGNTGKVVTLPMQVH